MDTKPFNDQIGGHKDRFLVSIDGKYIYKKTLKEEVDFYKQLYDGSLLSPSDECKAQMSALKDHIPRYHGHKE